MLFRSIENSGVAHYLEHMNFKGTKNRTREQLEADIESVGGQLNAYTSRENTSYSMTVFKNDAHKAIDIIGDMLTNSLYSENQVEAERESVLRECIEVHKDQYESTIENAHYTAFRDHMMGQPRKGIRENYHTITRDQIVDFHKSNYLGKNLVVVATGDVNH